MGVYVLWATGVIRVKMWFVTCQVDTSKWNFEDITGVFMDNFFVFLCALWENIVRTMEEEESQGQMGQLCFFFD